MRKKLFFIVILTLVAALFYSLGAYADNPIKIFVNGQEIKSDVQPQVVEGRTLVPLRAIAEALGAQVSWDNNTNTVNISTSPQASSEKPSNASNQQNQPTISKQEFDQISDGMTYQDVTGIIGGPGEVMSESGSPGSQFHTIMYKYDGEGSIGANAMLMFQGGKLLTKSQFGLK